MAIFVEGLTEQYFVHKLLMNIISVHRLEIKCDKRKSGNNRLNLVNLNRPSSASSSKEYFVLLYDSGQDEQVKSIIKDNYDSLVSNGYQKIVGLRDVYPNKITDIPFIEKHMQYGMKTSPVSPKIILAKMEIEAWFLAEVTHFARIHRNLTIGSIVNHLNFDPTNGNVEHRPHPSADIDSVYHLEGLAYSKKYNSISRTVEALDYPELYLNIRNRVTCLNDFVQEIDSFFS